METQTFQLSHPLLAEAEVAARDLGHSFVAPEHLLLAVARRGDGASGRVLARRGLTAAALRREVEALHEPVAAPVAGPLRLAQRAVVALGDATRARRSAPAGVSDADVLFEALLSDDVAQHAVVGAVLERAGIALADAREEFTRATAGEIDA